MDKVVKRYLIVVYILLVVFLTAYLFSYNKYGVSEFGDKVLLTNLNIEEYKSHSLVIVKKHNNDIKINDKIFFYYAYNAKNDVICRTVKNIEKTNEKETTYLLDDNKYLSSSYLIGKVSDATEIYYLGSVISFLTTKPVYFITVVIPLHLIFIYQVISVIRKRSETIEENIYHEV